MSRSRKFRLTQYENSGTAKEILAELPVLNPSGVRAPSKRWVSANRLWVDGWPVVRKSAAGKSAAGKSVVRESGGRKFATRKAVASVLAARRTS